MWGGGGGGGEEVREGAWRDAGVLCAEGGRERWVKVHGGMQYCV